MCKHTQHMQMHTESNGIRNMFAFWHRSSVLFKMIVVDMYKVAMNNELFM